MSSVAFQKQTILLICLNCWILV